MTGENLLQVDLAVIPIATTIMIAIGATSFAVSVGLDFEIPLVTEDMVNLNMPEGIKYEILTGLSDHTMMLTTVGIGMMIIGAVYKSAKLSNTCEKILKGEY